MAKPKLLWIINGHAGRGEIAAHVMECIDIFQKAGYDVTVHITQKENDAFEAAQERGCEFDRIVCAGGDGTLNQVVSGLMKGEARPPLGYIPAGTTNDFANSLDIPKQPVDAAQLAVSGQLRALDIGRWCDRYFNYVAAFGAFTEVSYETPQNFKNVFGRAAYLMEGVKAITNIKTHHLEIRSAEFTGTGDFIYGMVSNAFAVGGFKTISADGVALDDGLYEVLLVRPFKKPSQLQALVNDLLFSKPESDRYMYFKTSLISFKADTEVPWTLDGEFGGAKREVEIENTCRAVTFAVGLEESKNPAV